MKRPALEDVRALNRRLKAGFLAEKKNGTVPSEVFTVINVLDWVTNGSDTRTMKEMEQWLKDHNQ